MSELLVKKKDAFAQLPSTFSIEGLFVMPTAVGGTLVYLLRAQIEGLHTRVMAIANRMHQLAPVCSQSSLLTMEIQD